MIVEVADLRDQTRFDVVDPLLHYSHIVLHLVVELTLVMGLSLPQCTHASEIHVGIPDNIGATIIVRAGRPSTLPLAF